MISSKGVACPCRTRTRFANSIAYPFFDLIEPMRENLASAALALAALLVLGCSHSTTYTSKDGSVTVEQKGKDQGSMTFTSKDGNKVEVNSSGGKVPDDYPKDLPVYGDAKVTLSTSVSEKNARNLILESPDAADKITDFYKKGLESNGWKLDGSMNMGEMSMFTATKDKRKAVIQVINEKDKRTINQVLTDQ